MFPPLLPVLFLLPAAAAAAPPPPAMAQDSIANFQPSLAVVIGMLSIMFSLTFVLLLYAKFCHRASSVHNLTHQIQDSLVRSRSRISGVDKTVVESLPFFRFSSLRGSRDGLECAVCLAKFEDVEVLRLLPKCKHAFHIDCIDQWLEKHSTCPLCRHKVTAEDLSHLSFSTSLRFLTGAGADSIRLDSNNLELHVQREESRHGSSRFSIASFSFRKTAAAAAAAAAANEERIPIQSSMDSEEPPSDHSKTLHKFNHKIDLVVSDVVLKNRWSNVSSSDLMVLNSEMLNYVSSARFSSSSMDRRNPAGDVEITENVADDHVMDIREEMERKRVFEKKIREIKESTNRTLIPAGLPATLLPESNSRKVESKAAALSQSDKRSMSEIIVHPRFMEITRNKVSSVKEERTRRIWLPIARKTVQWFANRERTTSPHRSNM
ncbi:E3 ubiquitin-protein ligase ATL42-like [Andrographis paniculata]|uniref:E3 ubiquitin-protein ligase ATL42-like n=1 Tax=Andrographis paniculata TaxID=175694 RepID=UPI0021E9494B|nr:E3 ubiquitin-protein ligase ATL42-like [Andrographis paniculata]